MTDDDDPRSFTYLTIKRNRPALLKYIKRDGRLVIEGDETTAELFYAAEWLADNVRKAA
jgi:hypothetical protein